MKYTVIVGGNIVVVTAKQVDIGDNSVQFSGDNGELVAEFNRARIDGWVKEDNNVYDNA